MGVALSAAVTFASGAAFAQEDALAQTLFTNVHVFDGMNEADAIEAVVKVHDAILQLRQIAWPMRRQQRK